MNAVEATESLSKTLAANCVVIAAVKINHFKPRNQHGAPKVSNHHSHVTEHVASHSGAFRQQCSYHRPRNIRASSICHASLNRCAKGPCDTQAALTQGRISKCRHENRLTTCHSKRAIYHSVVSSPICRMPTARRGCCCCCIRRFKVVYYSDGGTRETYVVSQCTTCSITNNGTVTGCDKYFICNKLLP